MRTSESARRLGSDRVAGRPRAVALAVILLLSAAGLCPPIGAAHAPAPPGVTASTSEALPPLAGRSLAEALALLQARGWPVVFSSRLVTESMRVTAEPTGDSPAALLAELLRPHRLAVREAPGHRLVVVAAPKSIGSSSAGGRDARAATEGAPSSRPAGRAATSEAKIAPAADLEEEIVVTPAHDSRRGTSTVSFADERGPSATPPSLGQDALAAVAALPGASSANSQAEVSVRGGDDGDVLVLLDGLELVEPYHLGDFDHAVSFVSSATVDRAELYTGSYPAQYGDRMSGVVDLTTRSPSNGRHLMLGIGVLEAEGSISQGLGGFANWLLAARSGNYQWPLELSGRDQHPHYWDTFGKIELDLGPRQTLLADLLIARDRFSLSSESNLNDDRYDSSWDSSYGWIRHSAVLGSDFYVETVAGTGDIDQEREGRSTAPGRPFVAHDRRGLESATARQGWHWEAGPLGALEWGFEVERSDTLLDVWSDRLAQPSILRFGSTDAAGYASTELHPAKRLSLEIGVRHDTLSLSDESHLSPRVQTAWEISPRSLVRASWGWFYQSQRPYMLQLDAGMNGQLSAIASERAEHQDLGFEHRLASGLMVSLAAYRRRVDAPRVRFENLFDPVLGFPELAGDRVRVAPDRGSSEGIELTLRQSRRGRFGWWASYVQSSVVDQIDGRRVPRSTDQPQSFRLGLDYRAGRAWDLDAVWQYHTGWPTTAIEARPVTEADGSTTWDAVLGPRNAERLPAYHRLDLRLSRSFSLPLGRLEAHLDLLDVYDRDNRRGFENVRVLPDGAGGAAVARDPVSWAGFTPAAGVRWTF